MANVEEKCDLAYSLIEKCKKNDTALVEEKPNIFKLIEEVSSFIQKCELESVETDSLTCYFEYKLFDMLKTQIGGVRVLKPGKKGLLNKQLTRQKTSKNLTLLYSDRIKNVLIMK